MSNTVMVHGYPLLFLSHFILQAYTLKFTTTVLKPFHFVYFIMQCLENPVESPSGLIKIACDIIIGLVPPCAVIPCQTSIQKTANSYNCSHNQHIGVKAQPSKVDSNFFSIVFPVERKGFF